MKVNVISILWGNKYDEEDVNRLYSMIHRNTSHDIHFFLFSNNALPELRKEITKLPEPTESSDIYSETLNYRKEAGLCDDNLGGLKGERVFFFDLDVLITGNLDELFSYPQDEDFYIINDWNTKGDHVGQATCYSFVVGRLGFVKEGFEEKHTQIIDKFGTASQEYLSFCIIDHFGKLNFWPEAWFRSFKLHCLPIWPLRKFITPRRPPIGTKVLAFHGHPDLRDAIDGRWAPPGLKKSAKGWKKIYKQCRKTDWIKEYWQ
jgi:hypothetical protein